MTEKTLKASDLDWGLIVQLGAIALVAVIVILAVLAQAIFGINGVAWGGSALLLLASVLGLAGMVLSQA